MALRMQVNSQDSPSKTRSGTIYSYSNITPEDFECAKNLISLRTRLVVGTDYINHDIHHMYNTRHSSRNNTPRF